MTQHSPHSLLSLPPTMKNPDAYRVLGLSLFEADRSKIRSAAELKLAQLNQLKANADPAAWQSAAQMVKSAYAILGDASKKAAYDRKLNADAAATPPAVVDPLAAVLPANIKRPLSPIAAPKASSPVSSNVAQSVASSVDTMPATTPDSAMAASTLSPPSLPTAVPVVRRSSVKRRRFPWVPVILSTFCIAALGGLGALIYVLQFGKAGIIITTDGNMTLASADTDGDGRVISPPVNVSDRERRPYDPVMGGLAGQMPPPQQRQVDPGALSTDSTMMDSGDNRIAPTIPAQPGGEMAMGEPDMSMNPSDMSSADPAAPMRPSTEPTTPTNLLPESPNPAPETPAPPSPAPPSPAPATPEQLQAGAAAINAAALAIRQANWASMKPMAEAAEKAAADDAQRELATSLYQLADLATYYQGAIDKSLKTLTGGVEIDLNSELKLVIVEVATDRLVVRFNGKNKTYPMNQLPLSLVHKLAEMSTAVDESTATLARLAYQSIAPTATPPYRAAAVAELEKITDATDGADPVKLVAAIRFLNATQ